MCLMNELAKNTVFHGSSNPRSQTLPFLEYVKVLLSSSQVQGCKRRDTIMSLQRAPALEAGTWTAVPAVPWAGALFNFSEAQNPYL